MLLLHADRSIFLSLAGNEEFVMSDPIADAVRSFRKSHVQKNGETPAQTEARMAKAEKRAIAHDIIRRVPDIRHNLVEGIKAKIADGTYENDLKLDVAARRLLEDLAA
jgi:anti-sigma28 factor (negative regulator of flagellin synthesis)